MGIGLEFGLGSRFLAGDEFADGGVEIEMEVAGLGRVYESRLLDHKDHERFADRIDPRLGAVDAAMAERSRREHRGGADRLADDADAEAEAHARREAGFHVAGLDGGQPWKGSGGRREPRRRAASGKMKTCRSRWKIIHRRGRW